MIATPLISMSLFLCVLLVRIPVTLVGRARRGHTLEWTVPEFDACPLERIPAAVAREVDRDPEEADKSSVATRG